MKPNMRCPAKAASPLFWPALFKLTHYPPIVAKGAESGRSISRHLKYAEVPDLRDFSQQH
jgi:hypothetical protein